jgi:co-chaperonin GroES (HSP10)
MIMMIPPEDLVIPPEDLILPVGIKRIDTAAQDAAEDADAPSADDPGTAAMLPSPTGFHLLCAAPEPADYFDDSVLVKTPKLQQEEQSGTNVLFVLAVGPDAYGDKTRFPSGPWCKKGDWVIVRTYAGTRFKLFGKEFRLINDDQVEATVDDPRGLSRAY